MSVQSPGAQLQLADAAAQLQVSFIKARADDVGIYGLAFTDSGRMSNNQFSPLFFITTGHGLLNSNDAESD